MCFCHHCRRAVPCTRVCVHVCVSMFLLDIFNRRHSKPSVRTTASRLESAATFPTNTVISQIFIHSYKAKKIRHLFIWIRKDFALLLIQPQIPKSIWIKVFDYQFPSNPRLRPSVASADIRWACAAASGEEFRHTFSFLRRPRTIINQTQKDRIFNFAVTHTRAVIWSAFPSIIKQTTKEKIYYSYKQMSHSIPSGRPRTEKIPHTSGNMEQE